MTETPKPETQAGAMEARQFAEFIFLRSQNLDKSWAINEIERSIAARDARRDADAHEALAIGPCGKHPLVCYTEDEKITSVGNGVITKGYCDWCTEVAETSADARKQAIIDYQRTVEGSEKHGYITWEAHRAAIAGTQKIGETVALREAAKLLRCKCGDPKCRKTAPCVGPDEILALIPSNGQSLVDKHDAEIRADELERAIGYVASRNEEASLIYLRYRRDVLLAELGIPAQPEKP